MAQVLSSRVGSSFTCALAARVVIAKFVSFYRDLGTNERDLNDAGNIDVLV